MSLAMPGQKKQCEGCGLKRPHYGLPAERKARWCACAAAEGNGAVHLQSGDPRAHSADPGDHDQGEDAAIPIENPYCSSWLAAAFPLQFPLRVANPPTVCADREWVVSGSARPPWTIGGMAASKSAAGITYVHS